jgi:hypothetical protein
MYMAMRVDDLGNPGTCRTSEPSCVLCGAQPEQERVLYMLMCRPTWLPPRRFPPVPDGAVRGISHPGTGEPPPGWSYDGGRRWMPP